MANTPKITSEQADQLILDLRSKPFVAVVFDDPTKVYCSGVSAEQLQTALVVVRDLNAT